MIEHTFEPTGYYAEDGLVQATSEPGQSSVRSPFQFGVWYPIDYAPKDGTRILAIEGTDPKIVPIVIEFYDPKNDGFDGEPCWIHSEEVLSDLGHELEPIMWTPIPLQDFGD